MTTIYDSGIVGIFPYEVRYLNKEGKRLVSGFFSPYEARKFVCKLKRSKTLTLLSYPRFER